MIIIKTVVLTLLIYWTIGLILCYIDKIDIVYWYCCGLIGLIFLVVTYPVRTWISYSRSCNYYKKHGISRLQYMFGKRVGKVIDDEAKKYG